MDVDVVVVVVDQSSRPRNANSLHKFGLVCPFSAQLTVLPKPPNAMLYNAFQSPDTPNSATYSGGIYIPM